jgi:hypothetical protein
MSLPDLPPSAKVVIPESLQRQLDDFRRQLWRVKILEAVAAGCVGLMVSFLLVYGLDRIWQTPALLRFGILIAGVSIFAVVAPCWMHRWVWQQRRETQLARLIAKRFPGLGDRLLGAIELQQAHGSAETFSPRLREAAMAAVADEVAKRKLEDALPPQRHRRWAWGAGILAIAAVVAMIATPQAGLNALQRWLLPFSKMPRYTFTQLENPPTYRAVAFGEAFEISLTLAKTSAQRPQQALARYGLQPEITATRAGDTYRFLFPGQQDSSTVVFSIGDLRHAMRIEPMMRPGIEAITARVTSPAYLGIAEKSLDLKMGTLTAVNGSTVTIELNTTQPLATASFGPTRPQVIEEKLTAQNFKPAQGLLKTAGSLASTPPLEIGGVPFEIPFAWNDQLGLSGDAGFWIRVEALSDAAPTCYLQGVDRQKVMLPEETVDFEVLTEDDFGIRQMGIEWQGEFTRPTDEVPAKGELKLADGATEERRLLRPAVFSPATFGISPQKITLRGYAEDFLPQRGRIYSEPVVIYVLTRDEHAQMLENQFDRNIAEFEDLARRETELLDENQRLEKLSGEELQKEEPKARLEAQNQAEAETERRMEELTQRMENLMKDAARNGDITKETLKKMAESLKSMQELSKTDVPAVQEKLGDAQAPANTPEKTQKDVAEAAGEQQKVIEKMQQAIDRANDANRQFEAGTFVNRLKKAATEQGGIASSLMDAFDRILGAITTKLDPSDARRLSDAANQQMNIAADVRWIQDDLAHYFARTKTVTFEEILNGMKASQIDIELEKLRDLLICNKSYTAAEDSKKWAEQLAEWAKKLAGANEQGGGGGGGGSGPSPEDEDFEFMLRVMKLIQQEQDLRGQTRALEQLRRDSENSTEPRSHRP